MTDDPRIASFGRRARRSRNGTTGARIHATNMRCRNDCRSNRDATRTMQKEKGRQVPTLVPAEGSIRWMPDPSVLRCCRTRDGVLPTFVRDYEFPASSVVPLAGFELATFALRMRCSTN
jgi:hypothetical protein